MIIFALLPFVVGATPEPCGSVRVASAVSVRVEETTLPLVGVFLHPSGAVGTVTSWMGDIEYSTLPWSASLGWGAPLEVSGRVRELLPDGRLVVQRLVDERTLKIALDVADWTYGAKVSPRVHDLDLAGVATVACGLSPAQVKRGHVHDAVACVGGRLIAERPISLSASGNNTDGLFLWDQGNWRQIASSGHSLLPSELAAPRLLVTAPVEPAVLKALETAGVPFLVLPFAPRRATCGPDSCWGVTQDGRLMALDLRAGSEGPWVEVASGFPQGGLITLRVASEARALLHTDSCNSQVRYFQLPKSNILGHESRHVRDAGVR